MYSIDERLRGLPALKDQVVVLYQSLNQPNLAIPNRKAGPSIASVLGLRGPSGFAVFVYLHMPQSGESAVYVPGNGTVPAEQFQSEEAEALGFVESMGFIMDNLNFRGRPADEQEQMIRSLPVFQREAPAPQQTRASPAQGAKQASGQHPTLRELGKLFAAFTVALLVQGCVSIEERRKDAKLHYDIAVEQLLKDPQSAYKETTIALETDPENAEAWHLKALVLHQVFKRLEEAQLAYSKALQFKKPYPDAHVNLGNLYMDQKRYDDAINEYKIALTDVLYGAPYLAQGNMGWAYFKKGDNKTAIENLKGAVSTNPRYCLGEYQLAQIYESEANTADSCKYFTRFREHCPDSPDGWQHEAMCLANAGNREGAAKAFDTCVVKAASDDQKDLCKALKAQFVQ
jgi:type IV pilus assembly protein PilF